MKLSNGLGRRGFLGALLGLAAAPAIVSAIPAEAPVSFGVNFQWDSAVGLSLAEVQERYLNPAMECFARDIDARCARFGYSQRITVADSRRFDPARLPL